MLLGLCVAAPLGYLGVFALYPLVYQAYGSVASWPGLHPVGFVGLLNYRHLLENPMAISAIQNTAVYVGITVPIEVSLGVASAWVTVRRRRGQAVLATLFVLPLVIPWSTAASLFDAIFEPNGVLNAVLACVFGVHHPPQYFADPAYSFAMVIWLGVWKGAPWCYLLLLGALAAIPPEMLESARLDGARGVSFWTRIVLPSIRPMFVFVIIFRVLAEAQTFTSVSLLTGGGPFGSTELVSLYGYNLAFQDFVWGVAAAAGSLVGAALLVTAMAGVGLMEARTGQGRLEDARLSSGDSFPPEHEDGERSVTGLVAQVPYVSGAASWGQGGGGHSRDALFAPLGVGGRLSTRSPRPPSPFRRVARLAPYLQQSAALVGRLGSSVQQHSRDARDRCGHSVTCGTRRLRSGSLAPKVPTISNLRCTRLPGDPGYRAYSSAVPGDGEARPRQLLAGPRAVVRRCRPASCDLLSSAHVRGGAGGAGREYGVDGATTPRIVGTLVLPLASSAIVAVSVLVTVQAWNEVTLAATLLNSSQLYTLPVLGAVQFGTTVPISAGWITYVPPLLVFIACQRWFRQRFDSNKAAALAGRSVAGAYRPRSDSSPDGLAGTAGGKACGCASRLKRRSVLLVIQRPQPTGGQATTGAHRNQVPSKNTASATLAGPSRCLGSATAAVWSSG